SSSTTRINSPRPRGVSTDNGAAWRPGRASRPDSPPPNVPLDPKEYGRPPEPPGDAPEQICDRSDGCVSMLYLAARMYPRGWPGGGACLGQAVTATCRGPSRMPHAGYYCQRGPNLTAKLIFFRRAAPERAERAAAVPGKRPCLPCRKRKPQIPGGFQVQ